MQLSKPLNAMCVNYTTVKRHGLERFNVEPPQKDWVEEIFQDYVAPIVVLGEDIQRKALLASFGMKPKRKYLQGEFKKTTMNTRAERVGVAAEYKGAWREGRRCLVPMVRYFEPSHESGAAVRWQIAFQGEPEFAAAGIWRSWEEADGTLTHSFAMFTVNADAHPLLNRFHRPGEEKRGLVILRPDDYDDWLRVADPEQARFWLALRPADEMTTAPAPMPPRVPKKVPPAALPQQESLF
ncbi:SOS response-associated peptidase family protein [Massilia sp. SM-13]|uniref:SOS response-associated peptidase family protein n=1 Tax=Pseudoduganella rhizocola TaxID=3382643 RepID=UPI0038B42344